VEHADGWRGPRQAAAFPDGRRLRELCVAGNLQSLGGITGSDPQDCVHKMQELFRAWRVNPCSRVDSYKSNVIVGQNRRFWSGGRAGVARGVGK